MEKKALERAQRKIMNELGSDLEFADSEWSKYGPDGSGAHESLEDSEISSQKEQPKEEAPEDKE